MDVHCSSLWGTCEAFMTQISAFKTPQAVSTGINHVRILSMNYTERRFQSAFRRVQKHKNLPPKRKDMSQRRIFTSKRNHSYWPCDLSKPLQFFRDSLMRYKRQDICNCNFRSWSRKQGYRNKHLFYPNSAHSQLVNQ